MWKQTEYGVLPFSAFTHNTPLAINDKEVKALKDIKFDPENYIEEKLNSNHSFKLLPKTVVYCLSLNRYVTILKPLEQGNTFLCRVRK
jgi:hypothetical protein